MSKFLLLAFFIANKSGVSSVISLTGHSSHILIDYYNEFRLFIESHLEENYTIVGGKSIAVYIDKFKIEKLKYKNGHCVGGVWILEGG